MAHEITNKDESRLFWKRTPDRTYNSKEEKKTPGFKATQENLMILLGGNSDGGHKLKSCLLYHSENPLALEEKARLEFVFIMEQIPKLGSQ
jgi:hypothetical protein